MAKVRARASFFAARRDGSEAFVGLGQEVEDTHELVTGREALFEPVDPATEPSAPKRRATRKTTPKAKA